MSQFAYVSLICGYVSLICAIDEQFKLLLCRHRATGNRESLRGARRNRRCVQDEYGMPITLAFRQTLNPTSHVGNVRQLTDT